MRSLQLTLEVFLRWGKPAVPCLWPVTGVVHLKIHLAEVQYLGGGGGGDVSGGDVSVTKYSSCL